jgi:hypothetical protein
MNMFALIQNNSVVLVEPEIVTVDGIDYAMSDRFHPDVLANFVQLTHDQAAVVRSGWLYAGGKFISAPEPPVLEAEAFTWKTDIWDRCTDDEASALDAGLQEAPVKERRMWDDANSVMHNNPLYITLRSTFAARFGEERADMIFAPSK